MLSVDDFYQQIWTVRIRMTLKKWLGVTAKTNIDIMPQSFELQKLN